MVKQKEKQYLLVNHPGFWAQDLKDDDGDNDQDGDDHDGDDNDGKPSAAFLPSCSAHQQFKLHNSGRLGSSGCSKDLETVAKVFSYASSSTLHPRQ